MFDFALSGDRVEFLEHRVEPADYRYPVNPLDLLFNGAGRRKNTCARLAEGSQQRAVLKLADNLRVDPFGGKPLFQRSPGRRSFHGQKEGRAIQMRRKGLAIPRGKG